MFKGGLLTHIQGGGIVGGFVYDYMTEKVSQSSNMLGIKKPLQRRLLC